MFQFWLSLIERASGELLKSFGTTWKGVATAIGIFVLVVLLKFIRLRFNWAEMQEHWIKNIRDIVIVTLSTWFIWLLVTTASVIYEDHQELTSLRDINQQLRASNGALLQEKDKLKTEKDALKTENASLKSVKKSTGNSGFQPILQAGIVALGEQGKTKLLSIEVRNGGNATADARSVTSISIDGSLLPRVNLQAIIAPGIPRYLNAFIADKTYEEVMLGKAKLEVEFTMDYNVVGSKEGYHYYYRAYYNHDRSVFIIVQEK
jgi:hypothetical protein